MPVILNHTIFGQVLSLNKSTSVIVYSTEEGLHLCTARANGFFSPTIVRHAELKSCSPVIRTGAVFLLSGLLHIICYCFTPVKGHSSWPRLQACESFSSSLARSRLRGHERLEQGVGDVIVSVSKTTARGLAACVFIHTHTHTHLSAIWNFR